MSIDFTPIGRIVMRGEARRSDSWGSAGEQIQRRVLGSLVGEGMKTTYGRASGLASLTVDSSLYEQYRDKIPLREYEDIREFVMRMIHGESNVLWPGECRNFAQSSGTSGGRSKYIPVTSRNLQKNHYRGAKDLVAHYLRSHPESRLFSGKAMILGGSFANQLNLTDPKVKVGDVSATLINRINPIVNLFRVPSKEIALIPDWEVKLPRLAEAAMNENITNISGVPSWFLTVLKEIMRLKGVEKISDVWPNLEVFFHGGISFEPYREEYKSLTDASKMHFFESYNASEGFFAVQTDEEDSGMLLLIDNDVFYEFIPLGENEDAIIPLWEVEPGKVYELVISSSNGLWRYRLGDTVRVESVNPVRIRIAGRTKSYINAFGEELMEENAERAVGIVSARLGCAVQNYTVAPVFAKNERRGRHQWLVEWKTRPSDIDLFARTLDEELRKVNSDYDAKRSHTIFLDPLEVVTLPEGSFDKWLRHVGSHKLGGQRKVPRLSNDRHVADMILSLAGK